VSVEPVAVSAYGELAPRFNLGFLVLDDRQRSRNGVGARDERRRRVPYSHFDVCFQGLQKNRYAAEVLTAAFIRFPVPAAGAIVRPARTRRVCAHLKDGSLGDRAPRSGRKRCV
jgi:hypothetical protein